MTMGARSLVGFLLIVAGSGCSAEVEGYDAEETGSLSSAVTRTTTLCFKYPGTFEADLGEDYFDEGVATSRPARGLWVRMRQREGSVVTFDAGMFLDDLGCTPFQAFPVGALEVRMDTTGRIFGSTFEVKDMVQGGVIQSHDFVVNVLATSSTQTFSVTPNSTAEQAFNVAQAAGWVLRRMGTGTPPKVVIQVNAEVSKSQYKTSANTVQLKPGAHDKQWTVGHELGHWALEVLTDFDDNLFGCSHEANSIGTQACAFTEGFANWYAASAFNLIGQADCRYRGVDCDLGASPPTASCTSKPNLPTQVMATCDTSGGSLSGKGNETDWARVLWNLRAPNTGVTFEEILEWIDAANDGATPWSETNVYILLNRRANLQSEALNTLWDEHKEVHGLYIWP